MERKGEREIRSGFPGSKRASNKMQPLYDTITLAAAESIIGVRRFFQSNTIASGAPKTLAATNMEQPGSLPTATSFRIQGLTVDADNTSQNGNMLFLLGVFLRSSSVSLQVGVKNYWQSPLRFACGRMQQTIGSVAQLYQQYGWAAVQPVVFQGKHVVDVNPLQNFQIAWSTQAQDLTAAQQAFVIATGDELKFVASLKGLLRRPVQ
jgi:hypothetical protein